MSARIDVVNFALGILGSSAITSIEDDSKEAEFMKTFYYIARDATLEAANWTFATRLFKPALSATAPEWGFTSAFLLPSDIMRVTRVDRNGGYSGAFASDPMERDPVPHVLRERHILCDETEIFCEGITRNDDEGIYSSLFVEAFAAKLAYLAALPLTESMAKQQSALALHVGLLKSAKARDGMQNTTRRMRDKRLLNIRG